MFLRKKVLRICSKFTEEHPSRSVIPIKLQNNFIEITLRHGRYPVKLLHIFRTSFFRTIFQNIFCKEYLWIVFVVWLTDEIRLALFPAGTIVGDLHHRESPTHREQDLNLRRTWGQTSLNEVVH